MDLEGLGRGSARKKAFKNDHHKLRIGVKSSFNKHQPVTKAARLGPLVLVLVIQIGFIVVPIFCPPS